MFTTLFPSKPPRFTYSSLFLLYTISIKFQSCISSQCPFVTFVALCSLNPSTNQVEIASKGLLQQEIRKAVPAPLPPHTAQRECYLYLECVLILVPQLLQSITYFGENTNSNTHLFLFREQMYSFKVINQAPDDKWQPNAKIYIKHI